jgi:ABC-type phosphate/phosphonate transport system substrate-binding protein
MRTGKVAGGGILLAVCCVLGQSQHSFPAEESAPARAVKIGVVNTMFRDTPPSLISLLSRPLKVLMHAQTGVDGDLELAGDPISLAKKLKAHKVQLGVFHGFEFAWARQQCPELKPLVISVAQHRLMHAHLVVRKDSPVRTCGDLKGKVVSLPSISRAHLHLFLERRCPAWGSDPKKFFAEVRRPSDPEDALDDVVDGVIAAAIVEREALDRFQQNKPARLNKLRVLQQSETFPASVIAYYPGGLDEATLKRMREGLISADKSPQSKDLLKMCRITNFEDIPADYEQLLAEIIKAYPPPTRAKERN